jgi:hypothetical protein
MADIEGRFPGNGDDGSLIGGPWFRGCREIALHDKTPRPSGETCDRDESANSQKKRLGVMRVMLEELVSLSYYGSGESKFRKFETLFDSRRFKNCPAVWK